MILDAWGWPRGKVWGGRREEGSGWGTHVYLWRIHFNIWQNQYNIIKFKNKIKLKQTKKEKKNKKERHHFANKDLCSQSYGFSSHHVRMWELDYKESWAPKNWCFWMVLEKTLESPLDCKEIKPVNPKGNHSWIFIGRTDAEAEVPMIWPPDVKSWLIGKDPDSGKDWR